MKSNIHVVLVEPGNSKNIGSVARAMHNLEFSNLSLVNPRNYDKSHAAVTACWATSILDSLQLTTSLEEALSEDQLAIGFSCSQGRNRRRHKMLPQWLADDFKPRIKTALIFGPEENGLRAEHLGHCSQLVQIPSSANNPSFNLAQAVLLSLYEINKTLPLSAVEPKQFDAATLSQYYQLDLLVLEAAIRSGFHKDETSEAIDSITKSLFRRCQADQREMNVLLGLFSKISKALKDEET